MKTTNLAKAGRDFLAKNPSATTKDLVEKLGFGKAYANTFMYVHKKTMQISNLEDPSKGQKVVRDELVNAFKHIEFLETQLANLEHQTIGYEAVISYLEHKLDLED